MWADVYILGRGKGHIEAFKLKSNGKEYSYILGRVLIIIILCNQSLPI